MNDVVAQHSLPIPTSETNRRLAVRQRDGWLGVDIGQRTIKFVTIGNRRGQYHLQTADLVPRAIASNEAAEAHAAADDLRRWVREARPKQIQTACLAAKSGYLFENVTSKSDAPDRVEDSIWDQLGRRYGISPDIATIDYWPINVSSSANAESSYQVVAFRRQTAEAILDAASRSRLQVKCIDSPTKVASRCARLDDRAQQVKTLGVLDLGFANSTLTVVHHGVPRYTRMLRSCGLVNLIDHASASLAVSSQSTETLLLHYCRPDREPTPSSRMIQSRVDAAIREFCRVIARELSRTFDFARSRLRLPTIEQIIAIGGGATDLTIRPLQDELSTPIAEFEASWLETSADPTFSPAIFANAIALATLPFFKN